MSDDVTWNPVIALVILGLFGSLCIGLRTWIHVRRTGESPFRDGAAFRQWAATTGRFVPRVGRQEPEFRS